MYVKFPSIVDKKVQNKLRFIDPLTKIYILPYLFSLFSLHIDSPVQGMAPAPVMLL